MTSTLPTREFYVEYGDEGDNTVEDGKVLGLYLSFFENLFAMDGQMACNITSFSTAFRPYQDAGRVKQVMKCCVQRNFILG